MRRNRLFLMIAIVFLFCLTLNVKAVTITTDSTKKGTTDTNSYLVTNTGSITVTNLPEPISVNTTGKDLIAVKIIDVFYNSTTNEITYEFTSAFKTFLSKNSNYKNLKVEDYLKLTSGDITSGSPVTASTLDLMLREYSVSDSNIYCKINSGVCNFTNLPAGAYVVRPYNYFNRAFSQMVGNILPTASNDTWTIQGTTIVAKTTEPIALNAYINKIGNKVGTFTKDSNLKYIVTVDYTNYVKNAYDNEPFYFYLNLPDVFKMKSISCNPSSCAFCATLAVSDNGVLLFSESSEDGYVSIKNTAGEEVGGYDNYSIFLALDKLSGNQVVLEYTLTNKENVTNLDVYYTKKLSANNEYTVKSETDSEFGLGELSSTVTLYSNYLQVLTYEKDNKSKILNGITFDVYSDEAMTKKVDTITTAFDGTAFSLYIGEGTFYLKQTKTVTGYSIVKPFSITIDSTNTEPFGTYTVEVPISKAGILPVTGGIGTIIYTAIGLCVIVGAVIVYTVYKKNNKEQELSD